jgi:glutathione synthase
MIPEKSSKFQTVPMLWITDPWNTLTHDQDTTLRLIDEAIGLGIPTFWSSSDLILQTQSAHTVNVFPCSTPLTSSTPPNFATGAIEMPVSDFRLIHYRVDPPVDLTYISLVNDILARDASAQIMSPPSILIHQSEKLPPAALSAYTPRLNAVLHKTDVKTTYEKFKNDAFIVTKPLNQAQSKGVKKTSVSTSLEEFETLMSFETNGFVNPIVVQEFLPEVNQGEVRMWFACGELVAALKKFPKDGDFRVLIDEGSKVAAYQLNESEQIAARAVGAVLNQQGVMMAAIDFIGGKISDYNITSPGLLIQLEKVHGGQNFARVILERMVSSCHS